MEHRNVKMPERHLEGVRSLGAGNPDGTILISRGCKGLQPSKSITAPGGRRSLGAVEPRWDKVLQPRLRGTATLQVRGTIEIFSLPSILPLFHY